GRRLVIRPGRFHCRLLAFLDQRPDAVAALLADLLVERSSTLRLDRLAALLADLLIEAGAALRLDGVAALLADLLVERAAALRLHRLAALAADLLVERVPVLVAHGLPALPAGLRHAHRALLLASALVSHFPAPPTRPVPEQTGYAHAAHCGASHARLSCPPRSDRARAVRRAFRSPGRTRPPAPPSRQARLYGRRSGPPTVPPRERSFPPRAGTNSIWMPVACSPRCRPSAVPPRVPCSATDLPLAPTFGHSGCRAPHIDERKLGRRAPPRKLPTVRDC